MITTTARARGDMRVVMAGAMKGWKYVGFISGIVGFTGVALYPIIIYPLQNIETYSKYTLLLRCLVYHILAF